MDSMQSTLFNLNANFYRVERMTPSNNSDLNGSTLMILSPKKDKEAETDPFSKLLNEEMQK